MANTNDLVKHIQTLNDQRLQNVDGAHEDLLDTINKLKITVQTPWETLWETRYQTLNSICKRIAIEMGIVKAIARHNGASVSAAQISAETHHDQQVIERILRVLTNINVFTETGESQYSANGTTQLLSTDEGLAMEKYFFDFLFPIGAELTKCIKETSLKQFPLPGEKGPFEYTFGWPLFDYLAQHPEMKQNFDLAMAGRREGSLVEWFHTYPVATRLLGEAGEDPRGTLLVDVAGNKGHDLLAFARAYPHFKGTLILEDLPGTFAGLGAEQESKINTAGIKLQEYDFFTPQPVAGARAYFFRDICHDWPDKQTRQLLGQTVKAMKPGYSRLLIEDFVLDESDVHHRPAASDVLLMLVLTGIERTHRQWMDLLESVSLEVVKIWPGKRGHQSVIEAIRK